MTAEQIVDIPVEIFILHRRLLVCRVRQIKGFSALFLEGNSATMGPHRGSELGADFSSSTQVAQLASPFLHEGFWEDDSGGMWMRLPSGKVVPSVQRARRVQGRCKGSGVRLLFMVLVACVVLASAYSFWSTSTPTITAASG